MAHVRVGLEAAASGQFHVTGAGDVHRLVGDGAGVAGSAVADLRGREAVASPVQDDGTAGGAHVDDATDVAPGGKTPVAHARSGERTGAPEHVQGGGLEGDAHRTILGPGCCLSPPWPTCA